MALHRDLTGDDLHEPKGAFSAPAGTVYVSLGNGSGVWKKPGVNEIDRSGLLGLTTRSQSVFHPNIRTNNKSAYAPVQVPGTLIRVSGSIDGSPTEDVTLVGTKNGVVTLFSITIAAGSAEGSQFSLSILPTVSFNQADLIKVLATGGAGGSLIVAANLEFTFNY